MKNVYTTKLFTYAIFIIISANLFGCATNGPPQIQFRSDDSLLQHNPIKKVVVLGEARVMRPRMGGKSAILSLSGSKLFLEDSMPKLKQAFIDKGYDVLLAEPVAVGYNWYGLSDYWIYNYTAKGDEPKKWQSDRGQPAFEYPFVKQGDQFRKSIREEYESQNHAAGNLRLSTYDPLKNNIEQIAAVNGADTVCFAGLWGKRYSAGRLAGDMALTVVFAMFGGVRSGLVEGKRVNIVCTQAATGRVVYQDTLYKPVDPLEGIVADFDSSANPDSNPDNEDSVDDDGVDDSTFSVSKDTFFDDVLAKLPKNGETLPANCRLIDRVRMTISCNDERVIVTDDSSF